MRILFAVDWRIVGGGVAVAVAVAVAEDAAAAAQIPTERRHDDGNNAYI
jgi:hypothetical protein